MAIRCSPVRKFPRLRKGGRALPVGNLTTIEVHHLELRFDRYVEPFTEEYLRRRWKDWSRIRSMLVHYAVPTIGTRRISDVRRADLTAIYRRLENRPLVARAMHATLRKMFKWAMSRDDLKHSPTQGVDAAPRRRNPEIDTSQPKNCVAHGKQVFNLRGNMARHFGR